MARRCRSPTLSRTGRNPRLIATPSTAELPLRQHHLVGDHHRPARGHSHTSRPRHDHRRPGGQRRSGADITSWLHRLIGNSLRTGLHRGCCHGRLPRRRSHKAWRRMAEAPLVFPDLHGNVLLVERLAATRRSCCHQQNRCPRGQMPPLPHRPHLSLSRPEVPIEEPLWTASQRPARAPLRGLAFMGQATLPHGVCGANEATGAERATHADGAKL